MDLLLAQSGARISQDGKKVKERTMYCNKIYRKIKVENKLRVFTIKVFANEHHRGKQKLEPRLEAEALHCIEDIEPDQ